MCLSAEELGQRDAGRNGQNQNQTTTGNGHYDVTYRDGKVVAPNNNNNTNGNRTPWYHELVGCLRPVLSFIGKEKQIDQSGAQGKNIYEKLVHFDI